MSDLPIRPSQRRGAGRVVRRAASTPAEVARSAAVSPPAMAPQAVTPESSLARPAVTRPLQTAAPSANTSIPAESQSPPHPARVPSPPAGRPRAAMIAEAAYYRAVRRDFAPGHELDDWIAAEREINERLARLRESPPETLEEATRGTH